MAPTRNTRRARRRAEIARTRADDARDAPTAGPAPARAAGFFWVGVIAVSIGTGAAMYAANPTAVNETAATAANFTFNGGLQARWDHIVQVVDECGDTAPTAIVEAVPELPPHAVNATCALVRGITDAADPIIRATAEAKNNWEAEWNRIKTVLEPIRAQIASVIGDTATVWLTNALGVVAAIRVARREMRHIREGGAWALFL